MKRLALLSLALASFASAQTPKPRLVVLISIDQFRQDYIRRFSEDFLPAKTGGGVGGFRYLLDSGADYMDAHHGHIPTATGPGHATLFTGSEPSLNGIVGNDWIDRETGKGVYCVDDASVETVGGTSKPMSARNLFTSTVGDELKLATNGKAKVVGISLKDRAAILMAGHAADTVIWFDAKGGNWVSSSYFFPAKQLPKWVQDENSLGIPKSTVGKAWEPLLPVDRYNLTRPAPFVPAGSGGGFSHPIKTMGDFGTSRFGNDFLFDTVGKAIGAEGLGQDDVPDVLVVNLASNDYVGHAYGPNSPEVMDMAVRADRLLSGLFNTIDHTVKGGLSRTLIVLTADHGVLPIPEEAEKLRMPSERLDERPMLDLLQEGLTASFGEGKWVLGKEEQNLYLNVKLIKEKGLARNIVEHRAAELLADAPGVYTALTRSQVMKGEVPTAGWSSMVMWSFNPKLSGDLIVIEKPGALFSGGTGTSHGTPWAYDTHVPLLLHGPGVMPGHYGRHVYTRDIASTVCMILGIEYPTGNMGTPLEEMLKK